MTELSNLPWYHKVWAYPAAWGLFGVYMSAFSLICILEYIRYRLDKDSY